MSAQEEEEYVEISVQDNGPGLSEEDVKCILNEKIYDSTKIGVHDASDVEALKKNKGSGFGLMNCKGIIEKYRKTNALFRVCGFFIESKVAKEADFISGCRRGYEGCWVYACCWYHLLGTAAVRIPDIPRRCRWIRW